MNTLSVVGYSVGRISLGLLLHPYQTMQSLVFERTFWWLSLLPTMILASLTLAWRLMIVPGVQVFFSCSSTGWVACQYLEFVSNWVTFFCLYWQIMLLYLLFRFYSVWRVEA